MSDTTPESLSLAVLTVSDTRTEANDTSGDFLVDSAIAAGHQVVDRAIEIDDRFRLRARVSAWIADPDVHVVLLTGGTGFTSRDATPEAIKPLLEVVIDGFGELFRQLSYQEIGHQRSSPELWPVSPIIRWCFVCQVPRAPAKRPGTALSKHNSIALTDPATSQNWCSEATIS